MPQLDTVHFFSQYLWLVVFYFLFYYLVAKHFLPRQARIIQFRKNKCLASDSEQKHTELDKVISSATTAWENASQVAHKFWSNRNQRIVLWSKEGVVAANRTFLTESNSRYVKSVGNTMLSQNAYLGVGLIPEPGISYLYLLCHQLEEQPHLKWKTSTTLSQSPSRKNSAPSVGDKQNPNPPKGLSKKKTK